MSEPKNPDETLESGASAEGPPRIAQPEGEEQRSAAARSQLYALFSQALSYPDAEFCQWIREGGIGQPLRELLPDAAPTIDAAAAIDPAALSSAGEGDTLAIEYTRLFDAGAKGPPCPLYGGLYGDGRMKTMEEAVRFYNHFGLTLSEAQRELPDHLVTQLEFLHYLCFREVEALQQGADPAPLQRAQRDFIARHPGLWVPRLCEKLEKNRALPFFASLLGALAALLAAEGARLGEPA